MASTHRARRQAPRKARRPYKRSNFPLFERYEHEKHRLVERILTQIEVRKIKGESSYSKMAKLAGVGVQTIRRLSAGDTMFPGFDTLWKLARAAGMRLGEKE